jgi:hypothetical protein
MKTKIKLLTNQLINFKIISTTLNKTINKILPFKTGIIYLSFYLNQLNILDINYYIILFINDFIIKIKIYLL